jgi:surface antigen/uncharacterized protein YoxC
MKRLFRFKKQKLSKKVLILALLLIVASSFIVPFTLYNNKTVEAATIDELRAQADALQAQIDANNAQADAFANEANTLQDKIAEYDWQINQIDTQIQLITVKIQQLDQELIEAQKELDRQKNLLKAALQALYKKGGASTVELLVGSDSFSQFINDQTYLERLKASIQTSTEQVIALKQQIQAQQEEQKNLLRQQQDAKTTAEVARAERANLLAQVQGQEANYRAVSADLQAQQQQLINEIVARSWVLTNVGTGSYPWADYREGTWNHWDSCGYSDDGDPWGYCKRQCVSYVAWKLYATGKQPPRNYGNAADWMWRTPYGQRGNTPQVGAVAVWGGYWGHVAYVESVFQENGSTMIIVSEYNAVPSLQGMYSQRKMYAGDPSMYLYFPNI